MKKLKFLTLLVFLSGFTASIMADSMAQTMQTSDVEQESNMNVDPTLAFFASLSTCTPGVYTEKNILTSEVGQSLLKQQIIGLSDDNLSCNAILMTPDNRTLVCVFPMYKLVQVNDQHFLEGVLDANTDSPTQKSINADMLWSQLKADSCSLDLNY